MKYKQAVNRIGSLKFVFVVVLLTIVLTFFVTVTSIRWSLLASGDRSIKVDNTEKTHYVAKNSNALSQQDIDARKEKNISMSNEMDRHRLTKNTANGPRERYKQTGFQSPILEHAIPVDLAGGWAEIPKMPSPLSPEYQKICTQIHGRRGVMHAIATLVMGDRSALQVLGLFQSLRDVNTCSSIPIIAMLSGGGTGSADCMKKYKSKRLKEKYCKGLHPYNASDIVSQRFLDSFHRLNITIRLVSQMPRSKYVNIPGGMRHSWGAAFNKLRVFELTEYDKVTYLDSDVMVLKNLDHLMFYPDLTAAFTNDCCAKRAKPELGGGLWVVQPHPARIEQILSMTSEVAPPPIARSKPSTSWRLGDMTVVRVMYQNLTNSAKFTLDKRQGALNFQSLDRRYEMLNLSHPTRPASADDITTIPLNKAHFKNRSYAITAPPGDTNLGDIHAKEVGAPVRRIWHMLNASYDWCFAECHCLPERDMGKDQYFTVHFTCFPLKMGLSKPAKFGSVENLESKMETFPKCIQTYMRAWANAVRRALSLPV